MCHIATMKLSFCHDNIKGACGVHVLLGFDTDMHSDVYKKLKRHEPCDCEKILPLTEETCLAWATLHYLKHVIAGNAALQAKYKVADVRCMMRNGQALLAFHVNGPVNASFRAIRDLVKKFEPHKSKRIYKEYLKMLGGKFRELEYLYVLDKLHKSLDKDGLHFAMAGKIRGSSDKFKAKADKIRTFSKKLGGVKGGQKPSDKDRCKNLSTYELIKISGFQAILLRQYLFSLGGVNLILADKGIRVNMNDGQKLLKKAKDKKLIKKYVDRKLKKFIDNGKLLNMLKLNAVTKGHLNAKEACSLLRKRDIKSSELIETFHKAL